MDRLSTIDRELDVHAVREVWLAMFNGGLVFAQVALLTMRVEDGMLPRDNCCGLSFNFSEGSTSFMPRVSKISCVRIDIDSYARTIGWTWEGHYTKLLLGVEP